MKTSWMIGLLMIWVVIVGVVVLIVFDQNDSLPSPEPLIVDEVDEVVEGEEKEFEEVEEPGGLTKASCEGTGGSWEDCGSACRGMDAEVCIELCRAYCECETSDQCPAGYACGEYIDNVGICL